MKPEDCKSCDNLLDQVKRLSSENADFRIQMDNSKETSITLDLLLKDRVKRVDDLKKELEASELQTERYRKALQYIADCGKVNPMDVAHRALHPSEERA